MRSKKCRRKPRPRMLRNHFGMDDRTKEHLNIYMYPRAYFDTYWRGRDVPQGSLTSGAFSVSQSNAKAVEDYIASQAEHHRRKTFQEEYRDFLKKYEVAYDERYVWD
jgi:hypothetical protein